MNGMDDIRAQCDRIHDAVDQMELLTAELVLTHDAETYRILLGEVDSASLRVYQFRKALLREAREQAGKLRASLTVMERREEVDA